MESSKDKEECKEAINLAKERLAKEKSQKTKNHLHPQYSLRKILIPNMDKSKNSNVLKPSTTLFDQSELFKESKYKKVNILNLSILLQLLVVFLCFMITYT